jgi:hypothetical protein
MLAHSGAGSASAVRAHEELFAYWSSLRQDGRLPARRHIDPQDFKRHLPTVSLIEVRRDPLGYRLRLAGTGLYSVYGREITGKTLAEVYDADAADYWRHQLDQVVRERRPAVGFHSLAWRGAPHMSLLWLRLPLASDGEDVDMILGYDVPIGAHLESQPTGIRAA